MATLEAYYDRNATFLIKTFKREEPEKVLSFDVIVLKVYDNVLMAESIHVDDHLIVFDGYEETVRTDLWVIEDPEKPPLVYEDVSVVRGYAFNDEIKNYLIIRPVEPAGRMNRRGAYRVKVGVPCKVYCKEGYVNGYVRDVSTSGFGIEIKHGQVQDGSVKGNITIEFTDSSIDKNAITISGTCVRKQDKETYTIFGCRISQDTIAYNSYVMKKQAQKARVKDI